MAKNGINLANLTQVYQFADLALANYYQNISIPGNIDYQSQEFQDIRYAYEWYLIHIYTAQDVQSQVYNYNLTQVILSNMQTFTQQNIFANPFVYLFSTEEASLISILYGLGLLNETCLRSAQNACIYPHFASNLIFEFYNNNNNPYVKIYYNGNATNLCEDPNNQNTCTLN